MVWGLVFGYLEGRSFTNILGAGLSASFIDEENHRTKRDAMYAKDRKKFFFTFAPGLILLVFLYAFLAAFRDFRDNFAREIWDSLGFHSMPEIFTLSEIPIAVCVLIVIALMSFIKSNKLSFNVIHWVMLGGAAMIGLCTLLFEAGLIGPATWMVLVGLGLYVAYVPFGCIVFDSLIAMVGFVGTSGFMIYVCDAFGYLGSVGLMLYKNFGQPDLSWLKFFTQFAYLTSIVCSACLILSLLYFNKIVEKKKVLLDTEVDDLVKA